MSNKPKIWANCNAGCKWETVHKSDYDEFTKGLSNGTVVPFFSGFANFANKIALNYETSEIERIAIAECGLYVVDIDNVSDSNIHHTCVIIVTDITKITYGTISKKMADGSGTHECQVVMYPQGTDDTGKPWGMLVVEHNSSYDWVYKISKVSHIGSDDISG